MKKALLFLGFIGSSYLGFSQSVISASGQHLESGNLITNHTLGEVAVFTGEQSNVIVTQGFHQNLYTLTSIESIDEISFQVFPNPTSDYLTITSSIQEPITALLVNNNGQEIKSVNITKSVKMNIADLPNGIYFVRIISKDNEIMTISKLVKTN